MTPKSYRPQCTVDDRGERPQIRRSRRRKADWGKDTVTLTTWSERAMWFLIWKLGGFSGHSVAIELGECRSGMSKGWMRCRFNHMGREMQ